MALEAVGPQLELTTPDCSNGADYGANWVIKIVSAKYNAVKAASTPANAALSHEFVAKTALGINPG
jgi:hypothetical protein